MEKFAPKFRVNLVILLYSYDAWGKCTAYDKHGRQLPVHLGDWAAELTPDLFAGDIDTWGKPLLLVQNHVNILA